MTNSRTSSAPCGNQVSISFLQVVEYPGRPILGLVRFSSMWTLCEACSRRLRLENRTCFLSSLIRTGASGESSPVSVLLAAILFGFLWLIDWVRRQEDGKPSWKFCIVKAAWMSMFSLHQMFEIRPQCSSSLSGPANSSCGAALHDGLLIFLAVMFVLETQCSAD